MLPPNSASHREDLEAILRSAMERCLGSPAATSAAEITEAQVLTLYPSCHRSCGLERPHEPSQSHVHVMQVTEDALPLLSDNIRMISKANCCLSISWEMCSCLEFKYTNLVAHSPMSHYSYIRNIACDTRSAELSATVH